MTDTSHIQLAQIVAGVAWAAVALFYAPAGWRLVRRRGSVLDVFAAILSSVGLVQAGFTVRWHVWPHAIPTMGGDERSFWLALYVTSTVQAVAFVGASLAYQQVQRQLARKWEGHA